MSTIARSATSREMPAAPLLSHGFEFYPPEGYRRPMARKHLNIGGGQARRKAMGLSGRSGTATGGHRASPLKWETGQSTDWPGWTEAADAR